MQAGRAGAARPTWSGEALVARDLRGNQVLAAVQPIDPPGWLVVVEQPLEEAFAPLYASILRTVGLLAGGLVLSVLVSLVLAGRMARPIQALQAAAARIGAGEMEQRIQVRTGDELETLADEFNLMADRLSNSYTELEGKVDARTAALAAALHDVEDTSHRVEVASQHKSAFPGQHEPRAANSAQRHPWLYGVDTGWHLRRRPAGASSGRAAASRSGADATCLV